MPDSVQDLLRRLVGGDEAVSAEILVRARTSDRQLVTVAAAHLAQDADLLDALVRDHLSDHPDNTLAAWIGARQSRAD